MTQQHDQTGMTITNVLAVALVSEFDRARAWYQRLLDRPPNRRPMDGSAVWQLSSTGGLQINHAPERAGGGNIVIGAADVDALVVSCNQRGFELEAETDPTKQFRLAVISKYDHLRAGPSRRWGQPAPRLAAFEAAELGSGQLSPGHLGFAPNPSRPRLAPQCRAKASSFPRQAGRPTSPTRRASDHKGRSGCGRAAGQSTPGSSVAKNGPCGPRPVVSRCRRQPSLLRCQTRAGA